ncbi:hypothetical protein MKK58_02830 [Methylobacterium sp. J-078]|uniref:hypothetical protein n=1 Tax=Methylobacterium sp. J-078 TaxID=2836657 RepID=UPI001FB8CBF4|nr:hypothetical protein [Methylobacterium sp. J-078]MCJ2043484.1 hypothetical protein [Methylobacterium sp. J-078]
MSQKSATVRVALIGPQPAPVEVKAESHRRAACTGIEVEVGNVLVRVGPDAGEVQIAAVIRALKGTV